MPRRPQGLRRAAQSSLVDVEGAVAGVGGEGPVSNFGVMSSLLGFGFQFGVGLG